MLTAVLVSWQAIEHQVSLFFGMLLLLECGCLGVFAAGDLLLFYVFFEFTLIPLFFLIGIWGSEERRYAANKFFLYTLAGSLLTFLGLLTLVLWHYSESGTGRVLFSIADLLRFHQSQPMPAGLQWWVFLALFAGFAIKVPLFPLHTWLPLAHVQAPTAGSVILAGVLLKIGTYGFIRFNVPFLPTATAMLMPWLLVLSVAGIIYGALVALAQSDIKRLIAYSSVSHMGFCMLGLFALNVAATQGAVLQMVNHGISTGALFALVGMLYERYHTREIGGMGGLSRRLPILAFFMLLFTLSSIGLPGLNGFAGEILILLGAFQRAWAEGPAVMAVCLRTVSVLAVFGVVLGAWYMLWLVQRVFFGPLREPASEHAVQDLSWREIGALSPLAVLVFWIGLCPNYFLQPMAPALEQSTQMARTVLQQDVADTAAQARQPLIRTVAPPADVFDGVRQARQGGLGL
jgi:NADH-quinone oxidoreductase subunit M